MVRVDILIVGGGNAGATLAAALGARGIAVAVVDLLEPKTMFDEAFDGRTLAIAQRSSQVYREAGVWETLEQWAQPITRIVTSDQHAPMQLEYKAEDLGDLPLGYIFELHKFRRILYESAIQHACVKWFAPHRVTSLERTLTGVYATLDNGQEIQASLCVAADGRNSYIRSLTTIKTSQWSYNQTAIVCCIEHEKEHHGLALENFMPNGPFASLPMQGRRSSIVWSENPRYVKDLLTLEDDRFCDQLLLRLGSPFGKVQLIGKRWSYPLGAHIMHRYIDQRLVFVADAAHGMHPIAGQGFNMGIRDIIALIDVITQARELGLDMGGYTVLEKYQRARRWDNALMLGFTDLFTRAFSNQVSPLRFLRRTGLGIVENMPVLKRFFMNQAS